MRRRWWLRLATETFAHGRNASELAAALLRIPQRRNLAAWRRAGARQVTTDGKPRLVGITKRCNKYLRKLIIHGAQSVLPVLAASVTPLAGGLQGLLERMHKNAAVVALANKLARIRGSTTCRSAADVCWWWK